MLQWGFLRVPLHIRFPISQYHILVCADSIFGFLGEIRPLPIVSPTHAGERKDTINLLEIVTSIAPDRGPLIRL